MIEQWYGVNAARCELGLTVAQLAEQLGVDRKTIYRWESGESATPRMARLALAYLLVEQATTHGSEFTRRQVDDLRRWLESVKSQSW